MDRRLRIGVRGVSDGDGTGRGTDQRAAFWSIFDYSKGVFSSFRSPTGAMQRRIEHFLAHPSNVPLSL